MRLSKVLMALGIFSVLLTGCGGEQPEFPKNLEENIVSGSGEEARLPESADIESSTPSYGKTDISTLEGIIEEQTFDAWLDGWGEVTFASFMPEEKNSGEDLGDVRFQLLKDGATVYSLPGWNEENTLSNQQFGQVVAVAFQDFDDDGRLDIIVICEYALLSDPDIDKGYNEVRVYTQNEGEKEFVIDGLLSEFLMKQRYTDSIADVMAAKEEYKDYLASMDGSRSIYSQLGIMADNMDIWYSKPDYADDLYCYAVTDLDLNGRLELLVAKYGGTGEYTYSNFYEMNESYDGLTECETNFAEGESQPDIIEEFISVFCDDKGIFHYIFFDNLRIGAMEDVLITSALTLQNGKITNEPLRCMKVTYGEEQGGIAYTDGAGNEITEEDYKKAIENVFEGLTSYTVSFGWQNAVEVEGLSREEVMDKLEDSYNKFKHGTE